MRVHMGNACKEDDLSFCALFFSLSLSLNFLLRDLSFDIIRGALDTILEPSIRPSTPLYKKNKLCLLVWIGFTKYQPIIKWIFPRALSTYYTFMCLVFTTNHEQPQLYFFLPLQIHFILCWNNGLRCAIYDKSFRTWWAFLSFYFLNRQKVNLLNMACAVHKKT